MGEEKKQVPLRLSAKLYDDLRRWSEDEFRSVNGQIEYILSEAVKRRITAADVENNKQKDKGAIL